MVLILQNRSCWPLTIWQAQTPLGPKKPVYAPQQQREIWPTKWLQSGTSKKIASWNILWSPKPTDITTEWEGFRCLLSFQWIRLTYILERGMRSTFICCCLSFLPKVSYAFPSILHRIYWLSFFNASQSPLWCTSCTVVEKRLRGFFSVHSCLPCHRMAPGCYAFSLLMYFFF